MGPKRTAALIAIARRWARFDRIFEGPQTRGPKRRMAILRPPTAKWPVATQGGDAPAAARSDRYFGSRTGHQFAGFLAPAPTPDFEG